MKIYFFLENNGYVYGGISYRPMKNAIEADVPEDHEIFSSDSNAFKYKDGELIKDEERRKRLKENAEKDRNKLTDVEMNEQALLELANIVSQLKGGE